MIFASRFGCVAPDTAQYREDVVVDFINDDLYRLIEQSVPIACVDFILVMRDEKGLLDQVGLIERSSPYGNVWCHLGGRVRRGETLASAIERHLAETVTGAVIEVSTDPQPKHVYQWFPEGASPAPTAAFGTDSRKHAIGLSYLIDVGGDPVARPDGEALQFRFFPRSDLPERLWPGCRRLFNVLFRDE